jgi:amino acid transporter
MIMASRVLYGLADQGLSWRIFARINARTRTPLFATAVIAACVLVFALGFSLDRLARVTSFIALVVFSMVNASLWKLKRDRRDRAVFSVPLAVPVLGFLLCTGMICYQTVTWLLAIIE